MGKKNIKGAFGNRLKSAGTEVVSGPSAPASKAALRRQRQRANAQTRKAEASAEGWGAEKKRRKGVNTTSVVTVTLGTAAFREEHCITLDGGSSNPFETFDDARSQLGKDLMRQMNRQGYTNPTPIQAEIWPLVLQGHDVVAVAETGSGKTLAFLLPVLARISERASSATPNQIMLVQPKALVLAPTRELVQQIRLEVNKFLVGEVDVRPRVVAVFGGADKQEQIKKLKKGADVIIATPGRLLDLTSDGKEKASLVLSGVTYLVLDEADRMLDMGFEEDIRQIIGQCPKTGEPGEGGAASGAKAGTQRQTLFFTATWPKDVQDTATSLVGSSAIQVRIGRISGDGLTVNTLVTQVVSVVEEVDKISLLKQVLASQLGPGETAIVFAAKKSICDMIEEELKSVNECSWLGVLHSGKEQKERNAVLRTFRDATRGESEGRGVLVATDVASRGLDIPGVALVVVYDYGGGVERYIHRIGRTGRSGKSGHAVTFFTPGDEGATELVQLLQSAGQEVAPELAALVSKTADVSGHGSRGGQMSSRGRGGGRGFSHQDACGNSAAGDVTGRGRGGTSMRGKASGRGRGF